MQSSTYGSSIPDTMKGTLDAIQRRGCMKLSQSLSFYVSNSDLWIASNNYSPVKQGPPPELPQNLILLPHFLRDTHQVQKNHLHSLLLHQLLNILPLRFLLHHPCHNSRGFHQDPPAEQQYHQ
jgi:hypothetical protein